MTDKILKFTGLTKNDIDPAQVVDALREKEFSRILVIGVDNNEELYLASHTGNIGQCLLLMEIAKHHLLFEVKR